ncbi:hypothetical protein K788_0009109 [Paraburkholderia caribensis MBA4]|uniref:Uncharacterized protein n=1 Tax=Paraburkholderia caribensis MBA4 TaxID=1323664 RepID=A0A0P0RHU7_9BURK|nr:hypothetical protein K788_0009109 [Paraburkholderia caribensis MBA4]
MPVVQGRETHASSRRDHAAYEGLCERTLSFPVNGRVTASGE